MGMWSIENWCENQVVSDWNILHESSISFLNKLNLSSIHPFCNPDTAPNPYEIPGIPRQGPLLVHDHLETWYDVLITTIAMGIPSLAAMGELWLRLFASIIAPLGIAHLLYTEIFLFQQYNVNNNNKDFKNNIINNNTNNKLLSIICILTMASSVVLLTDTLYVLEYGPVYGGTLLITSTILCIQITKRYKMKKTLISIIMLLLLTINLIYDTNTNSITFGHIDDVVNIDEGLYYNNENTLASKITKHWSKNSYTYNKENGATPWFPTGDSRTGLPFILQKINPDPIFTRVWLPLPYDNEVIALDILFPTNNGYDNTKPVYMVLHGLNGGSKEEYIQDFALRRTSTFENSTVIVMIARGLMDLPVRGWNTFHGARWQDSHYTAMSIRKALNDDKQLLIGVGYSMGAIILSNMITRTGKDCSLDAAVSISGGLDMRYQIDFHRAKRLWQPILATELRDTFVIGKFGERVRSKLNIEQMKHLMRATHISGIDEVAIVIYHGFHDLTHYYSEMSALGDIPYYPLSNQYNNNEISTVPTNHRIHNVSIPFCVVHALDDPLITWRTVAANKGIMHPETLTKTCNGNLFILLTKRGGHVGWSLGWLPFINKWKWMSDIPKDFTEAVIKAKSEIS